LFKGEDVAIARQPIYDPESVVVQIDTRALTFWSSGLIALSTCVRGV
jgi:hypothetical protein